MPKPINDIALAFSASPPRAFAGMPQVAGAVGETRKLTAILVSDVVGAREGPARG
jgi:hypothetical protein